MLDNVSWTVLSLQLTEYCNRVLKRQVSHSQPPEVGTVRESVCRAIGSTMSYIIGIIFIKISVFGREL